MKDYIQKATTVKISAISRASVKIRDSFYTIEYGEERAVPNTDDVNLDIERKMLWDTCNTEVDNQIQDIVNMLKKNNWHEY